MRGCDRLDVNKRVRGLMGVSRASFASADETRELTGMMIGGVTALALPAGLPVYADARLLEMDYIILGAGSRSGKVKTAPQELEKLPSLEFIEGAVDYAGMTAAGSRAASHPGRYGFSERAAPLPENCNGR